MAVGEDLRRRDEARDDDEVGLGAAAGGEWPVAATGGSASGALSSAASEGLEGLEGVSPSPALRLSVPPVSPSCG